MDSEACGSASPVVLFIIQASPHIQGVSEPFLACNLAQESPGVGTVGSKGSGRSQDWLLAVKPQKVTLGLGR